MLRVVPGTPAEGAGIQEDDIITHVNGEKVFDKNTLFRELSKVPAETTVELAIERRDPLRTGRRTMTSVTLSKKYVESDRQPFAQIPDPAWRGLRVEYPSALPPQWNIEGGVTVDRRGASPSWRSSGIRRPGKPDCGEGNSSAMWAFTP